MPWRIQTSSWASLLVEALPLQGLGLQQLLAALDEGVVAAGEIEQAAAVELDDAGAQVAQEGAVVGDEEQRDAGSRGRHLLEPADRLDVEVVGRLVEQQQVGLGGEGAGEQRRIRLTDLLDALLQRPTACGIEGVLNVKQFRQQTLVAAHLQLPAEGVVVAERLPLRTEAAGHHLKDRPAQFLRHVLRQTRHLQPLLAIDDTGIRRHLARHQGEQGRLAGAVAPQQADAFSPFHLQADPVEQGGAAEGEGDVAKTQ
jgi:hypothetical protein